MFLLLLSTVVTAALAGCPAGSHEIPATSQCVVLQPEGETNGYFQAHYVCNQLGGELLSIHNGFTAGILYSIAKEAKITGQIFIGADKTRRDTWSWFDGTPFNYQSWAPGEPNTIISNQKCASFDMANLAWIASVCSKQHPYFCEVPAEECPDEWTAFNGSCYFVIESDAIDWTRARQTCTDLGADLASIHTPEENVFVKQLAGLSRIHYMTWIGFLCAGPNNQTYSWSDGTPVTFNNATDCDQSPSSYVIYSENAGPQSSGEWKSMKPSYLRESAICKKPFISSILMRLRKEHSLYTGRNNLLLAPANMTGDNKNRNKSK